MSIYIVPTNDGELVSWGPRRIVCLTTETVDLLYRLGEADRVVGVSGYTVFPPEARNKPFVSAFTSMRYDVIESLQPDLIIGFSDLQAEAAEELIQRGYNVLVTNQRTLAEIMETMVMIGRLVDQASEAEALVGELQQTIDTARRASQSRCRRPRVYFEEWDEPMIAGIAWVGELLEAVGGDDVFADRHGCSTASGRFVESSEVITRDPEIIIASWCGKKANLDAIRSRPGWREICAIHNDCVYEIKSDYCLQPGPALIVEGLPRLQTIVQQWSNNTGERETVRL